MGLTPNLRVCALLALASLACNALLPPAAPGQVPTSTPPATLTLAPSPTALQGFVTVLPAPLVTPSAPPPAFTPLPTHTAAPGQPAPTPAPAAGNYVVASGDTLPALALRFRTEPDDVLRRNPGLLQIAGALTQTLPPGLPLDLPPVAYADEVYGTVLLPDSEVVYSPAADDFDVRGFVLSQPGFLAGYTEVVTYTRPAQVGWEIVAEYARRYSINPRLLLALLEYQSGALSNPAPGDWLREHALAASAPTLAPGLSRQLGWAGNQLTYGYYAWRAGSALNFGLADGRFRSADARLNAGSFAVARLLGLLHKSEAFGRATGPEGLAATYRRLFGDAFSLAYSPLIPGGLTQPPLQLPFEPGKAWTYTGGPHPAWGRTLPWSALDFGPPTEVGGCVVSPEWVVAAADGLVTYSGDGLVELDTGGGWTIVYLHIATFERVAAGALLRAGERVGHPSCEGGRSTASHVQVARKYNGEWIAADGFTPFIMSGWRAGFGAASYRGTLTRGDQVVEACACARATQRIWLDP